MITNSSNVVSSKELQPLAFSRAQIKGMVIGKSLSHECNRNDKIREDKKRLFFFGIFFILRRKPLYSNFEPLFSLLIDQIWSVMIRQGGREKTICARKERKWVPKATMMNSPSQ